VTNAERLRTAKATIFDRIARFESIFELVCIFVIDMDRHMFVSPIQARPQSQSKVHPRQAKVVFLVRTVDRCTAFTMSVTQHSRKWLTL